jgi:predicted transcriptional regulator
MIWSLPFFPRIQYFESMGLVTKTKSGENGVVTLTQIGEMFI